MTAELYPYDYFGGLEDRDIEQDKAIERNWLIEEIIKPESPNITDNVKRCLEMLKSEQVFKIPISSGGNEYGNTPSVKGLVARQGSKLVDFQALVKFPEFHKGKAIVLKKNPESHFPLPQIEKLISNLESVLERLEELEVTKDPETFIYSIGEILRLLTKSINLLQNPPRNLSFPESNNDAMKKLFQDYESLCESAHHEISLEIVLFKNELCVDFRNLSKVTKKPWCDIDHHTNKSFSDKVKDELMQDRSKTVSNILREKGVYMEEPTLINNLMSKFNTQWTTLPQAQYFLNRCVTFNNKVVIEIGKVALTTSDPFLISTSSKLSALENSVSNYYTNLKL